MIPFYPAELKGAIHHPGSLIHLFTAQEHQGPEHLYPAAVEQLLFKSTALQLSFLTMPDFHNSLGWNNAEPTSNIVSLERRNKDCHLEKAIRMCVE